METDSTVILIDDANLPVMLRVRRRACQSGPGAGRHQTPGIGWSLN